MTNDENLPKQFCYDCIIKIESSYAFIKEAQNVDVTLKNLASRSESVIVEPEIPRAEFKEPKLQLTLPDYKLSIGISDYVSKGTNVNENINKINLHIPSVRPKTEPILNTIEKIDSTEKIVEKKIDASKNVDESKKFMCTVCKRSFISKVWFTKHMQKEHSDKKFSCSHCPKCKLHCTYLW